MKRIRLLVVFCVWVSASMGAAQVPGSSDVTTRAEALVDRMAAGDFAEAVKGFDATMTRVMPPDKLQEVWAGLEAQSGAFQRRTGSRMRKATGYEMAFVACRFEHGVWEVKVVFDQEGRIAGLFVLPGKAPASSAAVAPAPPRGVREVAVTVGAGGTWPLPGTLSLPAHGATGAVPGVVLVHGSGPNDRDETIGPNKPFRDLAWGLATRGIAVLRYDKRTKVYGVRALAPKPFTVQEETIDDALAAVRLLQATRGVDPRRVFLLGHSLGGYLAPRIARADPSLAGVIILAGMARHLEDAILEQTQYLAELSGKLSAGDQAQLAELREQVDKIKALQPADAASGDLILGAPPAYWLDLRGYDPLGTAEKLPGPWFVAQGGRDYQVTPAEFGQWKRALAGKSNATFKLYPALNHLFMAGTGPASPADYEPPGQVDPAVIADLADWIQRARFGL